MAELKTVVLTIMDGFGLTDRKEGNAIAAARTPELDRLFKTCPNTALGASGLDVGLPDGQMGNSEVGHTNIGAGRVVYQELTRITKSIKDGDFFANKAFNDAIDNCLNKGTSLHLYGLLSDGGVHSHNTHLYALLQLAKNKGLSDVFIHCFMDGRDVSPTSGINFISELLRVTNETGVGKIGVISGRYYAMDRDNRYDRVARAYDALVNNAGVKNPDALDVMNHSYKENVTDEFIVPTIVNEGGIKENDSVIFYNFRPDRAREITRCFVDPEFSEFPHEYFPVHYVCMTQYDALMPNVSVAFRPVSLDNTLGEYLSAKGMTQLRIAETEKYAHVTFFFNGGIEQVYENEDRILIPSPKVATYDLQPAMSADEVCNAVCAQILAKKYNVIILNFANCDMVGHTGDMDAAVSAAETVDKCVKRVNDAVDAVNGINIITADHGNADQMTSPLDGTVFTAHTTNPVPLIITGLDTRLRSGGILADIAPTILDILGLPVPKEMSGKTLLC